MMYAWERKIVRLGALLLAFGALVFVGVLALNGFNFDRFAQKVSYNQVTYTPEGAFNRMDISATDADIRLRIAEDGVCRVVCDASGRDSYTVEVQDGALVVHCERHWYDNIGIFLSEPELALYLPERDYAQARIHSVSGDILVEGLRIDALTLDATSGDVDLVNLELGDLDVETVSGEITLLDSAASGNVRMHSTSGEIELENADAASFEITTVSGDIHGTLRSGKEFSVRSVSGDVSVPESTPGGGAFDVSTTSGDVEIRIE